MTLTPSDFFGRDLADLTADERELAAELVDNGLLQYETTEVATFVVKPEAKPQNTMADWYRRNES